MKLKLRFLLGLALAGLVATNSFAQTPFCSSARCVAENGTLEAASNVITGGVFQQYSPKGARLTYVTVEAVSTALTSGATYSYTNLIPAGTVVQGCVAKVLTTITGASSIGIGDGTTATKWGATIGLPAGTTTTSASFTAAGPTLYTAATSVVLTANTSNFTAGVVRMSCFGYRLDPPTS